MSLHIEAAPGQIADRILLPGDPLRAKYIAEKFLDNPVCYNHIRNIFGYTLARIKASVFPSKAQAWAFRLFRFMPMN